MSQSSYAVKVNKSSPRQRVGVSFVAEDDIVRVSKIEPSGLASTTDLREGDKILSINGTEIPGLSAKETAAILRQSSGEIEILASNHEEEDIESFNKSVEEAETEAEYPNIASTMSPMLGLVILLIQILTVGFIFTHFDNGSDSDFNRKQYVAFRDVMVMLLLGFGYLMTFLEKYGLSAVGLTMLLTVLNMECNLIIESYFLTSCSEISITSIINAEFSAATLLISFGALIGRATPLQMCFLSIAQSFFYALNKVTIVFGLLRAEDVGGTLTIHMFGAYFGLAAAAALGPQNKPSMSNNAASRVSDVFAMIGTTLLWVYWPSFVGATETGIVKNEMHCMTNTILSLVGSTGASFYFSQMLNNGKFDAVHIQNSTLAGGVAIGATARLDMGPGIAIVVGLIAGTISTLGYFHSSPYLEEKFGIFDTCGVGNLHGYPSVLGGLVSILFVYLYPADFMEHEIGVQSLFQLIAVFCTLAVATISGFIAGKIIQFFNPLSFNDVPDYEDAVWWVFED